MTPIQGILFARQTEFFPPISNTQQLLSEIAESNRILLLQITLHRWGANENSNYQYGFQSKSILISMQFEIADIIDCNTKVVLSEQE